MNTAPTLTKRQRKATDPQAIARRERLLSYAKRLGAQIGDYFGANPVYKDINAHRIGSPAQWVKVRDGVPFVRAELKSSYTPAR